MRSLSIAKAGLADENEIVAVEDMMREIQKTTGWGVDREARLGVSRNRRQRVRCTTTPVLNMASPGSAQSPNQLLPATPSSGSAVTNPFFSGDFGLPNHPYQNWYESPNGAGGNE